MLGGNSAEDPKRAPANRDEATGPSKAPGPAASLEAFERALEGLLAPVRDKSAEGAALARDTMRFVLHDQAHSVLAAVRNDRLLSGGLRLSGYHPPNDVDGRLRHEAFYAVFEQAPVSLRLRWAQVLEAALNWHPSQWGLALPSGVHWPEALLVHAASAVQNVVRANAPLPKGLSIEGMEAMLEAAGLPANATLVAAWTRGPKPAWSHARNSLIVAALSGYDQAVLRDTDLIRACLARGNVDDRLHGIGLLVRLPAASLAPLAPELADMATSSSKQVRAAVQPLIETCREHVRPLLQTLAVQAKPEQRLNALRLLADMARLDGDADLLAFVRDTAQADKAPSIQALPAEWDARESARTSPSDRYTYDVPVLRWDNASTPETTAALDAFWKAANREIENANRKSREHHARMVAEGHKALVGRAVHQWPELDRTELAELKASIASSDPVPANHGKRARARPYNSNLVNDPLQRLAIAPGVTVPALLKTLAHFDALVDNNEYLAFSACTALNAMHAAHGHPSLLELSERLDAMGYKGGRTLLGTYCRSWGGHIAKPWSADAVWPFFAHHVDRLVEMLNPARTRDYYWFDRKSLYRAIATLPFPPGPIVHALFDLALGTGKSDRLPAQEALANSPGKEARIVQALTDGKSEVRAIAAQWLERLRYEPAIPALEVAVTKEKHDVPKGAMLDALQAMGQPVEKYLDRDVLKKESVKSLAKGVPKELEWFPWTALPSVRWGDSGERVDTPVLHWLLVQSFRHKSSEPNAVLRKYCAMFDARDREALGQFVLETWMAEDIRPIAAEEANKRARAQAQSTHQAIKAYPKYYVDSPLKDKTEDELFANFLPGQLRQPAGSAAGSKGLLGVAAACATERAAPQVSRYLKEYYGTRASQGKALIAMLAWIEHPGATQLMLSVGHRFRTKSFQEEATRQAEALADRKGWTLAELADRTIPTAGFDEDGVLELSYGSRSFSAKLLPDFKVELYNPDGKKIASLSEPRGDDDAEAAKQSKKALASARKELKSIVELQTDRLYEALCTGRDWGSDEWSRYINRHPVVRHLAQRLVWIATQDKQVVASFRPLDDGTLTDSDDHPVTLSPQARVGVAHDTNLSPEQVGKWQQHLLDYEVTSLFQQFGKGTYELPANKSGAHQIKDFEGHLIEAFALRGRASKLGYSRGPAEDGGWFMTYAKRFPTLGLTAEVGFTGNPLPETNRTVALLYLSFENSQAEVGMHATLPLSEVPKVLLSECYNDLRLIAADGSGFSQDWQKKSEY